MKRIPIQKEKGAVVRQLAVKAGRVLQGEHIRRLGRFSIPLIFFSCCFIFLLRYIDPAVIYSSNGINIHTYVTLMHATYAFSYTDLLYRHLFILELTPEYLRENTIAAEPIDRYCTYRLLNFQYSYWRDLRVCQRDLTSFAETMLVNTQNYTRNEAGNDAFKCVNCHMPMNNDPSRFVLQLRSKAGGVETLIAIDDTIATLSSRFGHAAWHPSGRYIAFAIYKVQQYFHAVGGQFLLNA
ncbi:MAG: hypothetical protein JW913_14135 [Chitinispirillaceae bacterium]|nr:hypothetical protein [Chitinispirillaceae bacterium]